MIDEHYARQSYRLLDIDYRPDPPLRESPLDAAPAVAPNPLPEPDLGEAQRHLVELQGGAMGGLAAMVVEGERLEPRALVERGLFWGLNGRAGWGHDQAPLFRLQRGRSQHLVMRNATAFEHPMHLHGHHLKLLSRNGEPETRRIWHDTVLVAPRETVELAFVADNPGDWLFHCHVLEHMKAGMVAVAQVA